MSLDISHTSEAAPCIDKAMKWNEEKKEMFTHSFYRRFHFLHQHQPTQHSVIQYIQTLLNDGHTAIQVQMHSHSLGLTSTT